MKTIILLCLISLSFIAIFDQANGYCCHVNGHRGWPPHCNIFGCNCDCAKCDGLYDKSCCTAEIAGIACPKQRKRRGLEPIQIANRTFTNVDANKDGIISVEEAVKFLVLEKGMTVEQLMANKEWFHSLDKNGDGKLQPTEMDGALKQI